MNYVDVADKGYAEKNKDLLLKKYKGYYIAICNLKVVGKGRTIIDLYNKVPMKYHGLFLVKNCTRPDLYDLE